MDWRRLSIWFLAGSIMLCGWCSLISGIGGWVMGYDLGQREARVALLPDTGVLVTRVEQGGPADLAGIERGNTLIGLNGVTIADVTVLHSELLRYQPGEEIQVTYRENLVEYVTTLVLAQRPGSATGLPYMGIYYTARAELPADI
jgi:PDZ domain-containing secreted protein